MKMMRWQRSVGLGAGAWLLLTAGDTYLSVAFAPIANAVVVAVGLVVFATLALVLHLQWGGWATLAMGAWASVASSILQTAQAWMPLLLLGLITLAFCSRLLRDHQRF